MAQGLTARQIRVANANRWFASYKFPESRIIEGTRVHQRTNFVVRLKPDEEISKSRATGFNPALVGGAFEKLPIQRGTIVTLEDLSQSFSDSQKVFSYLVAKNIIDREGVVNNEIYETEDFRKIHSNLVHILDSIRWNAFFLNYNILVKESNADNPITFYETIDNLLKIWFSHGEKDYSNLPLWNGKIRYSFLSHLLSAENVNINPTLLLQLINKWFQSEKNILYANHGEITRVHHVFEFIRLGNADKFSYLDNKTTLIKEGEYSVLHQIGVPLNFLDDPLKFLDSIRNVVSSIVRPFHAAGIVGVFWNYSLQVDLFLDVLRHANFDNNPRLLS